MPELEIKFTRSTPERRAAVFQIKLMFDEAHRLGEEGNLEAYAEQIAIIHHELAKADPKTQEKSQAARDEIIQTSADIKAYGVKYGRAFLDNHLESMGQRLSLFEDRLRIGLETEMVDSTLIKAGLIKLI